MFATGVTVGLAEWIIDDTCVCSYYFKNITKIVKVMTREHFCLCRRSLNKRQYQTFSSQYQMYVLW